VRASSTFYLGVSSEPRRLTVLRREHDEEVEAAIMSPHGTGTFEIGTWDEKPYDEQEGARLTRTRVTKTYRGDVEGKSTG
jgi:uncharacterized protein DUF3224